MAPGSQKCRGTMADLLNAPISTSTRPTLAARPVGGFAMRSDSRKLPPT
ncbi:Uncharacterised protein [Mycobacteroides abscessus subsp. abscessus]|nr:Uncharacterised protein [Mycobacteroides abscessus subsp. abscessus]